MHRSDRHTTRSLMAMKGTRKIAMATAHDFPTAKLADEAGIPILLVGDSLGMTVLGYESTLPVTMDEMIHHTKAVVRGAQKAMIVADMPFMSYQASTEQALLNAGRFLKEAGADAVKLEGGIERTELVHQMVANGIPVMGHIGLLPQSVKELGGYRVQGREKSAAEKIMQDAKALQAAGAFSLVIEAVPSELARQVTADLGIPVIGIGAGPGCDGQVLVANDLLGVQESTPKFVKPYASLAAMMRQAFTRYREEVENGSFPSKEHTY